MRRKAGRLQAVDLHVHVWGWHFHILARNISNSDVVQQAQDSIVNLAQRLANRTSAAVMAFAVFREAGRKNNRAVDGADDFERCHLPRIARQAVSTVGPLLRPEETALGQLLQYLGQKRQRDTVGVGDILGAGCLGRVAHGKVLQRDQAIVRFFGQLQHG